MLYREQPYPELRKLIDEKYNGTSKDFADALGISTVTLNERLQGRVQFKQDEIKKIKLIFNLSPDMLDRIFFTA